jgi:lactate dehydrogenase-like 2-hydroxyacid dehydrogenase
LAKPALLITRKLRPSVEKRAARTYSVILNPKDAVLSEDQLITACRSVDAVLPCHSERSSEQVMEAIGDRLKIIANHSVGTDHVDLLAAKAERLPEWW